MFHTEVGLLAGAIALGAVHGIEPGHGWPVAAAYALDRTNTWAYGFVASFIIGVGHLLSSVAMVVAFFYAKAYFDLAQVNEPIVILGDIRIGGPVSLVAGLLLVALGVREYRHGHSHGHRSDRNDRDRHGHHDHRDHRDHHDHRDRHGHGDRHGTGHRHRHGSSHSHADHGHAHRGLRARLGSVLPFVDGHSRSRASPEEAADRGLVGLTMLLIAGYAHFEETVERYTPYLPELSATVLVVMGVGFIAGLF